ncbi:DNA/RNA nuclease SfsA [Phenylobacterium sp.]|jgi:sugar fermentation stimulation protein A|uniref:DNA/RNA nuclease SfsA n=1 Tax=Phenylobacterium sp. TaxID=1871053 RepID=UPI002F940C42
MKFPSPLLRGTLVARYKRFFADVVLEDGSAVTAHCPNPGAMLGLNTPGLPCFLSTSDDPKRKLRHTLELVEADGGLIGINTLHPNRIVAEALAADAIPELAGYASHRREVKYGVNSRVDFLLEHPDRPRAWVEVKNVHLKRQPGLAEFPDCVAARSTKHLRELAAMAAEGERAVVLFVVQRTDCERFRPAADCDPKFAAALAEVAQAGVEVLVYGCEIAADGVHLARPMPWEGAPRTRA